MLTEKEITSLWDWSQYPEKTFFGAMAKAQVVLLSQGITGAGCASAQDRAATHAHSSFPKSEHPSKGDIPL